MSQTQKKSRMRNYAKMRIAGASSIRKMLKQEKYKGVFSSYQKDRILLACATLDAILKAWDE